MTQTSPDTPDATAIPAGEEETIRYRTLPWPADLWLLGAAIAAAFASIYMIFGLGNVFGLYVPLETEYFYFLIAVLLPLPFLVYLSTSQIIGKVCWREVVPASLALAVPAFLALQVAGVGLPGALSVVGDIALFAALLGLFAVPQVLRGLRFRSMPRFDILLAVLAFAVPAYFVARSGDILDLGWEYDAPQHAKYLAFALWALIMEATRRTGGTAIFYICLVVSTYPMYSHFAPGFLNGAAIPAEITAGFHVFGTESILGIPMTAFANLVIGFLIFGVALQHTGGGKFFLNLAFALLGTRRGGPAKVAIFSSGLMGSMSGSVITNVLTTGVMTVPAMKRVGFRPAYAGGVEACASTGGVLMPPVMGATAFVMATFLAIPYSEIVVAAIFPSIFFYLGLFLQIDAYAARNGLHGLPRADLPALSKVFREGWYFVAVFVALIFMLLYMQREAQAPYYATATLLIINQLSKTHRWTWSDLVNFVRGVGLLFAELLAILAGVGLIIGALTLTGKVGTITYELTQFAAGNTLLLLVMAAATSFVLGIGMTITAAYMFLAVTVAPALTQGGLDVLSVHLFLMYWGMISFITPPVAIGAFAAASVAKADPMRTGFEAMRLGSIIYFIPFFFVLNPALIGRGAVTEIVTVVTAAIAGIALIAGGLQGYFYGVGVLGTRLVAMLARAGLVLGGILLALPGNEIIGYGNLAINAAALVVVALGLAFAWLDRRSQPQGQIG
ncbi:TRAP transporter fused permease subunit [Marinovum sp.]|uniref:TRAP transporter permease n=1 Tax=Marinovum sp. TaxID=2024839 RepID=UPI002B269DFA|nr:TRAP transporter fused permease subunit [Marinovum sp.]